MLCLEFSGFINTRGKAPIGLQFEIARLLINFKVCSIDFHEYFRWIAPLKSVFSVTSWLNLSTVVPKCDFNLQFDFSLSVVLNLCSSFPGIHSWPATWCWTSQVKSQGKLMLSRQSHETTKSCEILIFVFSKNMLDNGLMSLALFYSYVQSFYKVLRSLKKS